jgi:hypothetical protein
LTTSLFIVGSIKGGTTFLHDALSRHPEIAMSRPKEPGFFADAEFPASRVRSLDEYRAIFPVTPRTKVKGEASVNNLYSQDAADRIHRFDPEARILISLRDPTDVIVSLHHHMVFHGHQPEPSLARALQGASSASAESLFPWLRYYDVVKFAEQIDRYLAVFPRENVRIVLFDDVTRNIEGELRTLLGWLGLDGSVRVDGVRQNERRDPRNLRLARWLRTPPSSIRTMGRLLPEGPKRTIARTMKRWNASPAYRKREDDAIRRRLRSELAAEVTSLERVLDRSLAHWLPAEGV